MLVDLFWCVWFASNVFISCCDLFMWSFRAYLLRQSYDTHWSRNVVILTKFSSLAAAKVVILTTFGAASDENLVKVATCSFQGICIHNPVVQITESIKLWILCQTVGMYCIQMWSKRYLAPSRDTWITVYRTLIRYMSDCRRHLVDYS